MDLGPFSVRFRTRKVVLCLLILVCIQERRFIVFEPSTIKLSVNETKWTGLWARTCATTLHILISNFGFGPEKLPDLSRNGPLAFIWHPKQWFFFINFYRHKLVPFYLQLIIRLKNTSGVYLKLHLGDPTFNRENTAYGTGVVTLSPPQGFIRDWGLDRSLDKGARCGNPLDNLHAGAKSLPSLVQPILLITKTPISLCGGLQVILFLFFF